MNKTKELIEQSSKYLCFTYNRYPVVFSKGKGCKLWDVDEDIKGTVPFTNKP